MIASMPKFDGKIEELKSLLGEIREEAKTLPPPARLQLVKTLEDELSATQMPPEIVMRQLVRPQEYAVWRVALELNLPQLVQKSGKITSAELAQQTGAEELLIQRIMRPLCCTRVFKEVGRYTYGPTPVSNFLAINTNMGDGVKYMFDVAGRVAGRLPEFIESINYKCPWTEHGAFPLAFGEGQDNFGYLSEHKKSLKHFQNFMAFTDAKRVMWYTFYPLEERLVSTFDPTVSPILLVDCGGGHGGDIKKLSAELSTKHADKLPMSTRLVLQDLDSVMMNNHSEKEFHIPPIEPVAHSFLDPQPPKYKHAKAYFMRRVVHNWNDENVIKMLTHLRDAMKPGYSKLLINDLVLPDEGAALWPSLIDINMMGLFSGAERSETEFEKLLQKIGGLKIENIYGDPSRDRLLEIIRVE